MKKADAAPLEVEAPAEGVEQRGAAGRERKRQGMDGEVAPRQVLLDRGSQGLDLGQAPGRA